MTRPLTGTTCPPFFQGRGPWWEKQWEWIVLHATFGGLLGHSPHLFHTLASPGPPLLICIHCSTLSGCRAPVVKVLSGWSGNKRPGCSRAAWAGQAVGAGLRPVLFICCFNLLFLYVSVLCSGKGEQQQHPPAICLSVLSV